jgi:hypothetical protein
VNRRLPRALWPLVLLLAIMAWRSAGCRKKDAKARVTPPGASAPPHWITPLMTAPPPRPTVTMWKGVTRAPALPE